MTDKQKRHSKNVLKKFKAVKSYAAHSENLKEFQHLSSCPTIT